ncbi:uncharacterized protein LOC141909238 [Tubulanus polymorphus]|uniref:uncharacterized protein LOC141909238 n=1 Tax=Tubulanus polymorphus TaxID=672921 RepID=UPI003DA4F238
MSQVLRLSCIRQAVILLDVRSAVCHRTLSTTGHNSYCNRSYSTKPKDLADKDELQAQHSELIKVMDARLKVLTNETIDEVTIPVGNLVLSSTSTFSSDVDGPYGHRGGHRAFENVLHFDRDFIDHRYSRQKSYDILSKLFTKSRSTETLKASTSTDGEYDYSTGLDTFKMQLKQLQNSHKNSSRSTGSEYTFGINETPTDWFIKTNTFARSSYEPRSIAKHSKPSTPLIDSSPGLKTDKSATTRKKNKTATKVKNPISKSSETVRVNSVIDDDISDQIVDDGLSGAFVEKVMSDEDLKEKVVLMLEKEQQGAITSVLNKVQKVTRDEKQRLLKMDPNEYELYLKRALFNKDLKTYVDACIHAKMLSKARSVVRYYNMTKHLKSHATHQIEDVSIYNQLMHAYAKMGRLDVLQQLFKDMKDTGIKATLQSYAACFECLARRKLFRKDIAKTILADIERDGYDVRDMLNSCCFNGTEKTLVLKAIQTVIPEFIPHPPLDPKTYTASILLEQYHHPLPAELVVEENPYGGVVPKDVLHHQAKAQMDIEMSDGVVVESIEKLPQYSLYMKEMKDVLGLWKKEWKIQLTKAFDRNLKFLKQKADSNNSLSIYPYLKALEPVQYIDLMMKEINLRSTESETYSPTIGYLWTALGLKVLDRFIIQDKVRNKHTKKIMKLYGEYIDLYSSDKMLFKNHREMWTHLYNRSTDGPDLDVGEKQWSPGVVRAVGKFLYDMILYDIKIDANLAKPAKERYERNVTL